MVGNKTFISFLGGPLRDIGVFIIPCSWVSLILFSPLGILLICVCILFVNQTKCSQWAVYILVLSKLTNTSKFTSSTLPTYLYIFVIVNVFIKLAPSGRTSLMKEMNGRAARRGSWALFGFGPKTNLQGGTEEVMGSFGTAHIRINVSTVYSLPHTRNNYIKSL